MAPEKRHYKRYIVTGEVAFRTASEGTTGKLVNVGMGGILILSDFSPPCGTNLTLLFVIHGYPGMYEAEGKAVRIQQGVLAVMFSEEPLGLKKLLLSLDEGGNKQVVSSASS